MYQREGELPDGAAAIEYRAQNAVVGADVNDDYRCYSFRWNGGDERLINRFEPIVDDSRVLHHIVLYKVPGGPGEGTEVGCGNDLEGAIYAWAPGQVPFQFPDGGLQVDNSHVYVLEIHYNNRAGHADVSDTSGVRLYHVPREGSVYGLVTLGPDGFSLPANSRTEVEGQCMVEREFNILAAAPHMHEIGQSLQTTVIRTVGTQEDVVTLRGGQFDTQIFYDTEVLVVRPGDRLETRCMFENTDNYTRRFGPFTDDEMCFNFLYVTPPALQSRCDEPIPDRGYMPGECAGQDAAGVGQVFEGDYHLGEPERRMGGEPPAPGTYRLSNFEVYLSSADYPPVVLDLEAMSSAVAGSMRVEEDGAFWLDTVGVSYAVTDTGAQFEYPINISFAGSMDLNISVPNQVSMEIDCPGNADRDIAFFAGGGELVIYQDFQVPTPGVAILSFEIVD